MISFDSLKEYISRLEHMEKLFLLYQELLYTKEKDYTTNLTLWLIKNKYKKISKGKTVPRYSRKYFNQKAIKLISNFLEKYHLEEVKFDMKSVENKYNCISNNQSLLFGLFLVECKQFVKKYTKIVNTRGIKEILKKIHLKVEKVSLENQGNNIKNYESDIKNYENDIKNYKSDIKNYESDNWDIVVCVTCRVEIKYKLLKYHLESKKHKKLKNEDEQIVRIVGDIKKGEEQLNKIKEILNNEN